MQREGRRSSGQGGTRGARGQYQEKVYQRGDTQARSLGRGSKGGGGDPQRYSERGNGI